MKPLLILGTRTLASEVADIAADITGVEIAGFVENMEREKCGETLDGLPIFWIDDIGRFSESHLAVCALGTTHRSRFVSEARSRGIQFATIVHPCARISHTSTVGEGSIISAGVIVATRTSIGRHVIVNRGALIGHHTTIGDYCSIMPGANIAGACQIGDSTYIGMGAIVTDHRKVGSHSVVGAGSVVTRDVESRVQVVGVPARVVKSDIDGR